MIRIIVLNAKGGSGKTTLATNLAACYAARGYTTALMDYDPQGSALAWAQVRPADAAALKVIDARDASRAPLSGAWQLKVPRGTQRVIVDTPAGLQGADLAGRIRPDDLLLVPVLASAIDLRATLAFVDDVLAATRLSPDCGRIGLIANRVRPGSPSQAMLARHLDRQPLPLVATLRDALPYLLAADQGLGIVELDTMRGLAQQLEMMRRIVQWAERGRSDTPARTAPGADAPPPAPARPDTPPPARAVRPANQPESAATADVVVPAFLQATGAR